MATVDIHPSSTAIRTTVLGICVSVVLIIVKSIAGYPGHSYALIADATESGADGAVVASGTLKLLFPTNETLGATLPAGTEMQSFVLEFILTFFLMLVIINVATGSKEQGMFAGLAIGSTVLLEAMFAGPICGASMNPIRSFAPALVSGHLEHLWIYMVATTLGAIDAIPVWRYLTHTKTETK